MKYSIVEYPQMTNRFAVWVSYPYGGGQVVKTFKTRKGAENWIKIHTF